MKLHYKYDDKMRLDAQSLRPWAVGSDPPQYNPNLTARELTMLRHIVWMLHDVLQDDDEAGQDVLEKIIQPLLFKDIKIEGVFDDFGETKP